MQFYPAPLFCRRRHQPRRDQIEEFRLYHEVVAFLHDTTIFAATRYAVMTLRDAKTLDHYDYLDRDIVYPNLGLY